jgi:uncharacterized protein
MWFEAARAGDLDTLHICLFWDQRVDALSDEGRTALSYAAEGGHVAAVTLLLERNADPNLHTAGTIRPLTAAIENEHWEIAAALVRAGADPNADRVASIVIAEPPKRQLLALMLKRGLDPHGSHPNYGPYIWFALNDAACLDLFFGAGFDLARFEREAGESLLERALSCGTLRMLSLLSLGADVNLPVDRTTGRTILMTVAAEEAGEHDVEALIRTLVKRGADLGARDADGLTALDHARERGNNVAARLLTRLRAEQARLAKQEAKARAAAEAKAARERNAAERKAAAAQRATTPKKAKAKPKPSKPARVRTNPDRGRTEDREDPKCTPEAPGWTLAEQTDPAEPMANVEFDEARDG